MTGTALEVVVGLELSFEDGEHLDNSGLCLFWTHQEESLIGLPASSLFPLASALVLLDECSPECRVSHTFHFTFPSRHSKK